MEPQRYFIVETRMREVVEVKPVRNVTEDEKGILRVGMGEPYTHEEVQTLDSVICIV